MIPVMRNSRVRRYAPDGFHAAARLGILMPLALLVGAPDAAAQELDCKAELAEMRAQAEARADEDPVMKVMLGQLGRAETACENGQLGLYSALTNPWKTILAESGDGQSDAENSIPELYYLVGTWCYTHDSGERAEYQIRQDGTYALRLSEYRWQEVQEGPFEEIFDRMRVIEQNEEAFRVEIGAHEAVFERGACDRG